MSDSLSNLPLPNERNVMGLDLSLTGTGVALTDTTLYSLRFSARKSDPKGDDRLVAIYDDIMWSLMLTTPELAVIEAIPQYSTGTQSLALVHGVARVALRKHGVPVVQVYPSTLKAWATGHGRADKLEMLRAVPEAYTERWDDSVDDNAVDAWWLRQIGFAYLGEPYVSGASDKYVSETLDKIKEIK